MLTIKTNTSSYNNEVPKKKNIAESLQNNIIDTSVKSNYILSNSFANKNAYFKSVVSNKAEISNISNQIKEDINEEPLEEEQQEDSVNKSMIEQDPEKIRQMIEVQKKLFEELEEEDENTQDLIQEKLASSINQSRVPFSKFQPKSLYNPDQKIKSKISIDIEKDETQKLLEMSPPNTAQKNKSSSSLKNTQKETTPEKDLKNKALNEEALEHQPKQEDNTKQE
jgi:hypothetical protein